jgi:hypothetical protein
MKRLKKIGACKIFLTSQKQEDGIYYTKERIYRSEFQEKKKMARNL